MLTLTVWDAHMDHTVYLSFAYPALDQSLNPWDLELPSLIFVIGMRIEEIPSASIPCAPLFFVGKECNSHLKRFYNLLSLERFRGPQCCWRDLFNMLCGQGLKSCGGAVGGLVDDVQRGVINPLKSGKFNIGADRVYVGLYIICRKVVQTP
jgi:hypothetical protein